MAERSADEHWMSVALDLAERGQGHVEPNPMVGCVIVKNGQKIAEGYHKQFGDDHAEIVALKNCSDDPCGATAYVTLEPCSHHGKTPPCAAALIEAKVARVVVGHLDPFSDVDGRGIQQLQQAGIPVQVGILHDRAERLTAPYRKLLTARRPWIIAKWAMTLDGKIATSMGDSQWISNERSRAIAHAIRGRVDAILVGIGTVQADDPLLTARPPGPRTATRVVVDSDLKIDTKCGLVQTADEFPTLIATTSAADQNKIEAVSSCQCEVLQLDGSTAGKRLEQLLGALGERKMTNVLVEGGSKILGSLLDLGQIDEVHTFIAPKLFGGQHAVSPIGGAGISVIADALKLKSVSIQDLDGDIYVSGRIG